MKLHGTMQVVQDELQIGGVGVSELAKVYGTPLYIYDETLIRETAHLFVASFKGNHVRGVVAYASKAFLTLAMAQLASQVGLAIDVASAGELYTVYKAGFDMAQVYFHGNNKLRVELELAVDLGCGTIILDHRAEFELLRSVLEYKKTSMNVFLRVNPGIDAHTHEYIKTTTLDSKFGESLFDPTIYSLLEEIASDPRMNLLGLHCHIGSQIFEPHSFLKAADSVLDFYTTCKEKIGLSLSQINLGGGFGVYYTNADAPIDLEVFLPSLMNHVEQGIQDRELSIDTVIIEPGRSIVCNAGSTLYRVGSSKKTMGGKNYVYIDGGMSDNIRPALYQADYEASIVNRMNESVSETYCVAGKLCESGDVIIKAVELVTPRRNDLLLVSSTGAYTFSMSSNYNRLMRPAVVFVKEGEHHLVVRRQNYDDLIQWDVSL